MLQRILPKWRGSDVGVALKWRGNDEVESTKIWREKNKEEKNQYDGRKKKYLGWGGQKKSCGCEGKT